MLNRSDLIGGDSRRERTLDGRLEPEWLAVILLAMVRQGDIVINLRGRRIGVDDLEQAAQMGVEELVRFNTIAKPKAVPVQVLRTLFAGLDLPDGLIGEAAQLGLAVQTLLQTVDREQDRALRARERLRSGIDYWRFSVLSDEEVRAWSERLDGYLKLLDALAMIKTPGHLRNFGWNEGEVRRSLKGRATVQEVERLQQMLDDLRGGLEYTYQASNYLPANHAWHNSVKEVRREYETLLRNPQQRSAPALRARLSGGLENLHDAYVEVYLAQHDRARLTPAHDARKVALVRDNRHLQLKALSSLALLPATALLQWEQRVQELVTCVGCTANDLRNRVVCPHCGYSANVELKLSALEMLETLEEELDTLYTQWTTTLLAELRKPAAQETIPLLPDATRTALTSFVQSGVLPAKVTRDLVDAIENALQGLEKVTFDGADLLLALTRAGMPCTPQELETRFRAFLHSQLRDATPDRIRIQIDW